MRGETGFPVTGLQDWYRDGQKFQCYTLFILQPTIFFLFFTILLHFRYDTYKNFTKREWDFHDSIIPYYLQYHYPDLIHIEEKTINYPSGERLDLIYDQVYDWSDNYCIHLWYRLHSFDHTPNDIKKMNTTFGQLARLIYYGSPDIIDN